MGYGRLVTCLDGKEIMEMSVGLRQAVGINAVEILQCPFGVVGNYGGDARESGVRLTRASD